jgi:hypothetical protein
MKGCSISKVIREMQIKIAVRNIFPSNWMKDIYVAFFFEEMGIGVGVDIGTAFLKSNANCTC